MMRHTSTPYLGLLLAWATLLVGCAQSRPFDDLWVTPRPLLDEVDAARPPSDVLGRDDVGMGAIADNAPLANPAGELTLHEAVRLTLRQSPALRAQGWGVAAAEADALQMGRPPNPRIGVSVENFAGPTGGATFERQTLRLSQVIELADKRGARQALGQATQRLRAWDYEQQRIDVAADAASRYIAVVVAQQRLAIAQQQLELAQSGYAIVLERVDAGAVPPVARDQPAVELTLQRIAVHQAEQDLIASRAELAASWGAASAEFESAAGALQGPAALPGLDELRELLPNSPGLARWGDEIARQERAYELAQANAVVDPTVGAGLRYFPDADDVAGVVELSVPLTVFDDNSHAILAARLRVSQVRARQQQAQAEAGRALTRAYARFGSAWFALTAINDDALPAAERSYAAAVDAYDSGVSEYLTVLDAQRTLLEIRNRRLDASRDLHLAVIELEKITATRLD